MAEPTVHELSIEEHARLADRVMRRQAGLSLRIAAVFAVLLLGLPLVNAVWPEAANTEVGGFTATWLFLAVLFYPITIALSFYFVRKSDKIEAECSDWRAVLAEPDAAKGAGR